MATTDSHNYLELRNKLKESLRQGMKRDSGSLLDEKKKAYNSYGSFFGTSETVMTQRVIKTLMENPHPRIPNSNASSAPMVTTESKVQILKKSRDYSFLFSDTAQVSTLPPNNGSHQPRQDLQPKILNRVKVILKKTVSQNPVVPSETPSAVPEKSTRDNTVEKPIVSKTNKKQVVDSMATVLGKTISKATQIAIPDKTVQKPVVPKTNQKLVVPKSKQTDTVQKRKRRELQEPPKGDYSDDLKAFRFIRKMRENNRRNYKYDDDDDISNMEASFDDIMKEERRSAKLAAKEDKEQLRAIEEEEKRERMRRNETKKCKLNNS